MNLKRTIEDLQDARFLKKNFEAFDRMSKDEFFSVDDVSNHVLAYKFNYKHSETGKKIRRIFNKYYK
jgi:hypothetical protein